MSVGQILLWQLADFNCGSWPYFIVSVGHWKNVSISSTFFCTARIRLEPPTRMTSFAHQVRGAHQMSLFYDSVALPSSLLLRGFFVPSLKLSQRIENQHKPNKYHKTTQKAHLQHLTPRPFGDPSTVSRQSLCIHTCIGGNLKTLFLSCRRKCVLLHLLLY